MDWVRLSVRVFDDPKMLAVSDDAFLLYLWGLAYAGAHETDGWIPAAAIRGADRTRRPKTSADELVKVGCWEGASGGYRIHNWAGHQPSREQMDAWRAYRDERREVERKRKAAYRDRLKTGDVPPSVPRDVPTSVPSGVPRDVPPSVPGSVTPLSLPQVRDVTVRDVDQDLRLDPKAALASIRDEEQPSSTNGEVRSPIESWLNPSLAALWRRAIARQPKLSEITLPHLERLHGELGPKEFLELLIRLSESAPERIRKSPAALVDAVAKQVHADAAALVRPEVPS